MLNVNVVLLDLIYRFSNQSKMGRGKTACQNSLAAASEVIKGPLLREAFASRDHNPHEIFANKIWCVNTRYTVAVTGHGQERPLKKGEKQRIERTGKLRQ